MTAEILLGLASVSAVSTSTNIIINHSSRFSSWWWRLWGSSCIRVLRDNIPGDRFHNMLSYFHLYADAIGIKDLQQICRKLPSNVDEITTFYIPIRHFYIQDREGNWIYTKALYNTQYEIIGFEFWTYGLIYVSASQASAMRDTIENIQGLKPTKKMVGKTVQMSLDEAIVQSLQVL